MEIKDITKKEEITPILIRELGLKHLRTKCKTSDLIIEWVKNNKQKFVTVAGELEKNNNINSDDDVKKLCKNLKGFAKNESTDDIMKLAARFARFGSRLYLCSDGSREREKYMKCVYNRLERELERKQMTIADALISIAKKKDVLIKGANTGNPVVERCIRNIMSSVDYLFISYVWDTDTRIKRMNESCREPSKRLADVHGADIVKVLVESFCEVLEQWLADMPDDKDFDKLKSSLQKLLNSLK